MADIEKLHKKVLQEIDLSKEVGDDELIEVIHRVLNEDKEGEYLSLKEKAGIGKELFNTFRKLDILQELLEDDEITEIMINGTENIFIEKEGRLLQLEKRFVDRRKLEDVIQQIVAGANRMVNESSPIVDARLSDGSRVNIVLHPVALNGPVVTIRKFSRDVMTMADFVKKHSISQEIDEFLKRIMVAKYNVFISGGTGAG